MYTSGSTGIPKGVILTHENIVSTLKGFTDTMPFKSSDIYLAYLPLAHVYELLSGTFLTLREWERCFTGDWRTLGLVELSLGRLYVNGRLTRNKKLVRWRLKTTAVLPLLCTDQSVTWYADDEVKETKLGNWTLIARIDRKHAIVTLYLCNISGVHSFVLFVLFSSRVSRTKGAVLWPGGSC